MNRQHITFLATAVLVLELPSVLRGQGREPFTTEDALNVASASIQAITPDGRYAAVTRWTARDRKNVDHLRFGDPTYIAPSLMEVLVIDANNGDTRSLFDTKVQARAFDWSPDGSTLAFLRREGETYRLYLHRVASGETAPVRLDTTKPIAANSPLSWLPDGSGLILSLRPDDWADRARSAYRAIAEGPIIVQDSRRPFLAWDAVRNLSQHSIPALVDPATGRVRDLFDTPTSVTGLTPSANGTQLSFVRVEPVKTSYDRRDGTEYTVETMTLADGSRRTLRTTTTERTTVRWNKAGTAFAFADDGEVFVQSIEDTSATRVTPEWTGEADDTARTRFSVTRWHPGGDALLLSSRHGYHLADVDAESVELVLEVRADDETIPIYRPVGWSPDGRYVYFTHSARDQWDRGLVRLDLQRGSVEDLMRDASLYGNWRFSENGERIFYSFSDGDQPSDLFVGNADLSRSTRLTQLNPWLATRALTRSELIEYLDVDGNTLYGVLYYPVDYDSTRRYPLVAEIYERFFDNGFNHRMNLLANAGFFAFRPSVNLEIGYPGEAWLKGVTAGINSLIDRGLVDKDKLGVHGTSYGGYATNLLITQTDRFAAAINISGKVNIISFLGDSPKITVRNYYAAENGQDRIGATLWEQPQKYIAHSAIMNADRINTPLLLMSGEGDWNVPATNQREMYYALRRLGKDVVWVHYMNAGHGAGRSSTVSDFHDHWARIIGWYTDHFEGSETDEGVRRESRDDRDGGRI